MKFTVIASRLALAAVLLANSGQAWAAVAASADAAPADAAPGAASGGGDGAQSGSTFHDKKDEEIVVTAALPQSRQDVLSGVAVLKAEELTAALRPSIGDTLQHTAGASATSFGPSASRPVLRGLQGERVRVLTNGIGSIDVSNTSVDHAAVVNPLLAERIEVLRGPQSLLYGSSAIGGVVNVIDGRIPNSVPDEPVHLQSLAGYGSAANERNISGSADVPLGSRFVIHADGSYLKTGDLRIGGFALTPALRREALVSALLPPDPVDPIEFAANAAVAGKLPNTASRTWSAGVGAAFIDSGGSLGVAYSHYDSLYGIPIRYATQPGEGQDAPRLTLQQERIDAKAELTPHGAAIDRITFRFGYADYRHAELAPDGSVGTTFLDHGLEGRLELGQTKRGAWSGVSGLQFVRRDFNVIGTEAFLPRNTTGQFGVFSVQQFDLGNLRLEAGGRWEHSSLSALPGPNQPQFFSGSRKFDSYSGSLGGAYTFAPGWKFGVNLSRTERAPAAEELFANGPHAGTEAFEVGDPALRQERATSVEALVRGRGEGYSIELSAYRTRFNNYIYEDRTGAVIDGLPEYQIRQADAIYYGFEAQGQLTLAKFGDWTVGADALADFVHAEIENYGPAPRIPPLRVLGGIGLKSSHFDLRGEAEHVTRQDRVAPNETTTPAYTMVNAELAVRPWGKERPLSFVLSANNIFDVDARRHASFLKDYAPLAGRDFRITARVDF